MRRRVRAVLIAAATCGALAAPAAFAQAAQAASAVFVQTDGLAGNQVLALDRAGDGTLTPAGTYATGGLGAALEGSVVDHLASQGSLALDAPDGLLLAVNAGSNTVSVFGVSGDRLALRQVVPAGGSLPVGIAVSDGLVYVLDAGEGGAVQGFRVQAGRLVALPGSERGLGLDPERRPQFVNTPGQVGFTPGGAQLIVTTKANGSAVDVFPVRPGGQLGRPHVNVLPGTVPFAFTFDALGHLELALAGTNSLASFTVREDGELAQLDTLATEQAATCWIVRAGDRVYASNAGSGSLTGARVRPDGTLAALPGPVPTDAGTVDAAATPSGRFVYVQAGGAGNVDEFQAEPGGALTRIGTLAIGDAGGEGIVVWP